MWNRPSKEDAYNQYTSFSLPQSGVFFVIQLCALHTAKRQGSGLYCYCSYFFHRCPRWFGLDLFFFYYLSIDLFGFFSCIYYLCGSFMNRRTGHYQVFSSQPADKIRPCAHEHKMTYIENSLRLSLFLSLNHTRSSFTGFFLLVTVNPSFEFVADQ